MQLVTQNNGTVSTFFVVDLGDVQKIKEGDGILGIGEDREMVR